MDILYVVSNGKGANDRVAVKQAALAKLTKEEHELLGALR